MSPTDRRTSASRACAWLVKGHFSLSTTTLDGALIRNEVKVSLSGPEAHAELNGVYLLNGTTHCDNHTTSVTTCPDCTSDELYKGIVAGKGTRVFNGKVYVKQDAQRTRALPEQRQHPAG